jgi:hypothetical protein
MSTVTKGGTNQGQIGIKTTHQHTSRLTRLSSTGKAAGQKKKYAISVRTGKA